MKTNAAVHPRPSSPQMQLPKKAAAGTSRLKRRVVVLSLILLLWMPSFGNANPPTDDLKLFEWTFPTMGTVISLQAYAKDQASAETAFYSTGKEIDRLVDIYSDYDLSSETSLLSESSGSEEFSQVSPELWQMLDASDRWHELSGGAFDASLGQLTRLWRMARKKKETPTSEQVVDALAHTGWRHVHLNREDRSARISLKGVRLDFGAIAKGYIVDRAYEHLKSEGLTCCFVNASGNMRFGEPPPGKKGWKVAIAPLREQDVPFRHLVLSNVGIATSGDLWQYQLVDGVRRSHILDPATGIGVIGPISATVIASNATDADALATVLNVLGHEKGGMLLEKHPEYEALIVSQESEPSRIRYTVTDGFAR